MGCAVYKTAWQMQAGMPDSNNFCLTERGAEFLVHAGAQLRL